MSRSRESSLGSVAMEEEEDDLYGAEASEVPVTNALTQASEDDEDDDDEGEDDDDDDSDIEIVTERADLGPDQVKAAKSAQKPTTSLQQPTPSTSTSAQQPTTRAAPTTIRISAEAPHPTAQPKPILLPGASYPAIRNSNTIDLDNVPLWEGKPITDLDIDADLAENMKPWRRPGADQSDYFNYGFDEFSWTLYCEKVKSMRAGIEGQKMEMSAMESIMGPLPQGIGGAGQQGGGNSPIPNSGGMGAGGMPGMMGMPGMPSQDEMMQVTMQYMQQNGIQDISQVDFGAVMQFMQGGGVGGMAGAPMGPSGGGQGGWNQQQGGYDGGGGGGGGRGGRRGRGRW